jgi:hypothetical protein
MTSNGGRRNSQGQCQLADPGNQSGLGLDPAENFYPYRVFGSAAKFRVASQQWESELLREMHE